MWGMINLRGFVIPNGQDSCSSDDDILYYIYEPLSIYLNLEPGGHWWRVSWIFSDFILTNVFRLEL